MEKGDIDAYIAKFEQVIRQAGLDVDQPLVVNKFARGLPHEMYNFIYTHKDPQTYEQWCNVTCRWHVRLDVSKVRSVADSSQKSVLIADPKPLLT
jgi:hypothetical protein